VFVENSGSKNDDVLSFREIIRDYGFSEQCTQFKDVKISSLESNKTTSLHLLKGEKTQVTIYHRRKSFIG